MLRRRRGDDFCGVSMAYPRRIGVVCEMYPRHLRPFHDIDALRKGTQVACLPVMCQVQAKRLRRGFSAAAVPIQRGCAADMAWLCCRSSAAAPWINHRLRRRSGLSAGLAVTRLRVRFRSRLGPVATEAVWLPAPIVHYGRAADTASIPPCTATVCATASTGAAVVLA